MKWYCHPFPYSKCRQTLGTSACPPYHVALVIGGTSVCSSDVPEMFSIIDDIMVPNMFQMIWGILGVLQRTHVSKSNFRRNQSWDFRTRLKPAWRRLSWRVRGAPHDSLKFNGVNRHEPTEIQRQNQLSSMQLNIALLLTYGFTSLQAKSGNSIG